MDKGKKLLLLVGLLSRAALGQPTAATPAGAVPTLNQCYGLADANDFPLARLSERLPRLPLLQARVDYQTAGSALAPSR